MVDVGETKPERAVKKSVEKEAEDAELAGRRPREKTQEEFYGCSERT